MKHSEYHAKFGRYKPSFGIVELLAQTADVSVVSDDGTWSGFKIFIRPQILERSNASTLYTAVDTAIPQLSDQGIVEMCRHIPFMWCNSQPDGCSSTRRERAARQDARPSNCFDLSGSSSCVPHQGHRIVASREKTIIGDVYSTHFTCSQTARQLALQRQLWHLVDSELDISYAEPDPAWRRNNLIVVTRTVIRRQLFEPTGTSAEWMENEIAEHPFALKLINHLNGDWALPRLVHHCNGCCSDLDACKLTTFSLLIEADITLSRESQLPSQDDWGTCGESSAQISLGLLIHGVLPRLIAYVLPNWAACNAGRLPNDAAEDASRQLKLAKKAYRTKVAWQATLTQAAGGCIYDFPSPQNS